MKVSNFNNTVVERTGLADDGRFKIAFNAKMAKILADGIYSDKITSIIRELACNAIDSHVESGQAERPIEIHLPGMFEPWFHVRDFGVGLDHDQVMNIYTTYGASTKTDSNAFIGQLGLGSKSPFSYVDAFDVTAIKNGVERQYSMYKSEDGMPSVALLLERNTTEPNGVTVKMPVLQSDFSNFKTKAANVFRWFTVKPAVVGMKDFAIPAVNVLFEGTGWRIRDRIGGYYQDNQNVPVALMGRVAYPLHSGSISGLNNNQSSLLNLPLVLDFEIGDLEIAASREALGYDARTQANIKAKLDIVLTELATQFEQEMKNAKTRWQAHATFRKIFGQGNDYRYDFERIFGNHGLKWNNQVIKSGSINFDTNDMYKSLTKPAITTISGTYKRVRSVEYHRSMTINCYQNSKIVFDDLERGGASRINYYHSSNNCNFEIYVFGDSPDKTRKEILEMLGNPEYILTSQLPKRPANTGVRGEKINMLEYNGRYNGGKKAWDPVDVELEDGGIYVELDSWTPLSNGKEFDKFYETIRLAKMLGILDKDAKIYAPRGGFKKKIAKMPEWENVFDIITEGLKQKLTPAVMQKVSDVQAYAEVSSNLNTYTWQVKWAFADANGTFTKFVNGMRALEAASKSVKNETALAELSGYMGNSVTLPTAVFNGTEAWDNVRKCYPMLALLLDNIHYYGFFTSDENRKPIQDYVNIIDANLAQVARKR